VRVVSLVPSVTETLAALDGADRLVGVTRYCVVGAPAGAERVGGTKNPSVERIVALAPDVVVANAEENRAADLDALRAAGLRVLVTHPRKVADVAGLLRELEQVAGRPGAAEPLLTDLEAAQLEAAAARPSRPLAALTLVWRKPWMGLGPDTYADDLLRCCGFANVLSGFDEPYPRLDPAFVLGPEIVLLPNEPYAFAEADLPAVRELLGAEVPQRFVDGRLLTWHGASTAAGLRTFSALASALATG
jgi:ABC-type Fe3+-hydroxamate transport system substrate-binding protein